MSPKIFPPSDATTNPGSRPAQKDDPELSRLTGWGSQDPEVLKIADRSLRRKAPVPSSTPAPKSETPNSSMPSETRADLWRMARERALEAQRSSPSTKILCLTSLIAQADARALAEKAPVPSSTTEPSSENE